MLGDRKYVQHFGYKCVRLENAFEFDLEGFSSRDTQMNEWLSNKALEYQESGLTSVWILTPCSGDTGVVAGFFTLSNTNLTRAEVPKKKRTAANTTPLEKVPATLIGKFAVDKELQGLKVSDILMFWAEKKACEAAASVGSSYLVVELRDEEPSRGKLSNFYKDRFHFFSLHPGGAGRLPALARHLKDVRAELDEFEEWLDNSEES